MSDKEKRMLSEDPHCACCDKWSRWVLTEDRKLWEDAAVAALQGNLSHWFFGLFLSTSSQAECARSQADALLSALRKKE